jgi:hypothetical protein
MCNTEDMVMRKRKPGMIAIALRRALADALDNGGTFLGLERETGVSRQSLMLFARGEREVSLGAAEQLCTHFGLELRPKRRGQR